jgi:hypothetical protein
MAVAEFTDLFDHVGHGLEAAVYAGTERAIECIQCGEVVADEATQTSDQMDALWEYYTAVSPGPEAWDKVVLALPATPRFCPCGELMDPIIAHQQGDELQCWACIREAQENERAARLGDDR